MELDFDINELYAIIEDIDLSDFPKPVKAAGLFSLRDYQEAAIQSIHDAFERHRSVLLVLATGLGKTVVFSQLTLECLCANPHTRVLILAHTEELLDQAADKLEKTTGLRSGREKADERASLREGVVIASVQTLGKEKRLESWPADHFDLIIIDEAHRSLAVTYRRVIDYFASAKVLGVTATADRGDQKSLGRIYETVAFEYGLLEGCRDGYLVKPKAVTVPLKIDLSGISVTRGDLDQSEVSARIEPILDEVAKVIAERDKTDPRKTILFLPSVDTAAMMAAALNAHGVPSDFVAGDKKRCPNRSKQLRWFAEGKIRALVNAMLLVEGFDDPGISRVVMLRATTRRGLFVQCCGRGTRILPGVIDGIDDKGERLAAINASAKKDLEILDFLWLTEKLNLIRPANLVSGDPEVVKRIQEKAEGEGDDLIDLEEKAERDLLESVRREAERNRNKKGKTFDPLAKAMSMGEEELIAYKPQSQWEAQRPTDDQCKVLIKHGLDPTRIRYRGLAALWIKKIITRERMGLCSLKQMSFLERLGLKDTSHYTKEDALKQTRKAMVGFKKRRGMFRR